MKGMGELNGVVCAYMGTGGVSPGVCCVYLRLVLEFLIFTSQLHMKRMASWSAPKITLRFPCLIFIYVCVSTLFTCTIITSRTLLPCNLTLVDFGNLDGCFA